MKKTNQEIFQQIEFQNSIIHSYDESISKMIQTKATNEENRIQNEQMKNWISKKLDNNNKRKKGKTPR